MKSLETGDLADPSKAVNDAEQVYLYTKRQYQLNEAWILKTIEQLNNHTKPLDQALQEIKVHLANLRSLSHGIIIFEENNKQYVSIKNIQNNIKVSV